MLGEGQVSRLPENLGNGAPQPLRLTPSGSLAVEQAMPPKAELSRAGRRFYLGNSAAITGIAPVQVLPTTAPQWSLFNKSTKKSLFFEVLGMYLTSGTPGVGGVLLGCLYQSPASVGVLVTGCAIQNANPASHMDSQLTVKNSVTITDPAAPVWFVLASNFGANVTAFASSTFLENRNLDGALVVPPQYALGLAVVAPAGTTPLFAPFAQWVEMATDLE